MRVRLRLHLLYWSFPAVEQLIILPLWLAAMNALGVNRTLVVIGAFLVLSYLSTFLRRAFPGMHRFWAALAILMPLAGVILLSARAPFPALLILAPLAWATLRVLKWTDLQEADPAFHSFVMIGTMLYPVCLFLFSRNSSLNALILPLSTGGTAAFLSSFLLMNRLQILQSVRMPTGDVRPPKPFAQGNYRLTLLFLAGTLFFSSIGFLADAARNLFALSGRLLGGILAFLIRLMERPVDEPAGEAMEGGSGGMPALEETEPAPWMRILEDIIMYVVLALLAAGLLWMIFSGLRRLYRNRTSIWNKLCGGVAAFMQQWLEGFGAHVQGDLGYSDEISTTREGGQSMVGATLKWLVGTAWNEPRWSALANDRDRARWVFRRMRRKAVRAGLHVDVAETPGRVIEQASSLLFKKPIDKEETLAFRRAYETARYGVDSPQEEAVEKMRDRLR